MPQGSILAPTLYIFCTSDLPAAGAGRTDVLFADDVTQIIEYMHHSKRALALRTKREIERINKFEKEWKIKTNKNKFKILSISKTKPEPIVIDHRRINFANNVNILGFNMGRTGFGVHLTKRTAIAKGTLTKLKRFRAIKSKTKSYLYKTSVRSALEYPNTPACIASNTKKMKLQKLQNNVIRKFIHWNAEDTDDDENIEQLHQLYKIELINVRMYRRARKSWDKLAIIDEALCNSSIEASQERNFKDHYWWKRVTSIIEEDKPEAEY